MMNDEVGDDRDLPEHAQRTLQLIMLVLKAIDELSSGASLFNVINLIDSDPFSGPIEKDCFGQCGIVWFVSQPNQEPRFEHRFCTAIGPKPQLEYGETEDLDTDKISDDARWKLLEKIRESNLGASIQPRDTDTLIAETRQLMRTTTSRQVPVCVIASYNVSKHSTITLLAHHPCIDQLLALELWLAHFNHP